LVYISGCSGLKKAGTKKGCTQMRTAFFGIKVFFLV
jgi:hypothetical protein